MKTVLLLPALLLTPLLQAAEEVKASHILVRSLDEADVIRNEIMEKGGDRKAFMEAARKHSKDTATKRAGGTLGWFTRQKMLREFSEAAFDTKVGQLSEPVKTAAGWHLIFVEDRREQAAPQIPQPPPPQPNNKVTTPGFVHPLPGAGDKPAPKTTDLAPGGVQVGSGAPPAGSKDPKAPPAPPTPQTSPTPQPEAVKVQPQKPKVPLKSLKLTLDIKDKLRPPSQTVEVELTLANNGEETQRVLAPDLLPLGLSVTPDAAAPPPAGAAPLAPSWDDLKGRKPETPFLTLASRRSVGATFSLNDYFKDLPPDGRYRLVWKPDLCFQNLEQVFPDIAVLADYQAVKSAYSDPNLRREVAGLRPRLMQRTRDPEAVFSVFEPVSTAPGKKYYASLEIERQPQQVWIELYADRQYQGASQFIRLALEGFYDGLELFDIQKGNFMRGGCPRNDGTGGPERPAAAQNTSRLPHEKGTISMVTRAARFGSKEVGSIFFICRKPHPEWDEEHIPIGKVIAGEDILDKVESGPGRPVVRKVLVVSGDKAPPSVVQASASTPPPASSPAQALPVAKIKTSKGELTVELYEPDAPNTVANFIKLAEQGFFSSDPQTHKEQTFYYAVPGMVLVGGSPTNDSQGDPGYRIPSETADNKKTHLKGTLTMLLERDPASENPVPDSAGSQFMICLQDLPAWNGLYTPFGRITAGQEILEKLAQGDKIESVTILNKRNRPYEVRKIQR